jgi:adenosylcobyric acid synthase
MKPKLLMIQGTSSGAGKSLIVTGLCRILSNKGFKVSPFKSQNMSSYIFNIGESNKIISKAQAVQALGAKTNPDVRMNPILLRPRGNNESEIFLLGDFFSKMNADEYYTKFVLNKGFKIALDAFESLRKENDIIVLEGAGSPSEINIMKYDIANMLLAEKVNAPVILISDIERGGSFASILGTISLLKPRHKKLVKGILINKFRGDKNILLPAIKSIEKLTGKPVLGIIPKIEHNIPEEDSLDNNKKKQSNGLDFDSIDNEINNLSYAIEASVDMDYIINKILN